MAVRMSGPAKVGIGELSRIARKKSPAAPRCRSVDNSVGLRLLLWACKSRLSTLAIYQARATVRVPASAIRERALPNLADKSGFQFTAIGPSYEHLFAFEANRNHRALLELTRRVPVACVQVVLPYVLDPVHIHDHRGPALRFLDLAHHLQFGFGPVS